MATPIFDNKETPVPVCIPLHKSGGKYGTDRELRFCLRALEKNFKDAFKVVIVAEELPEWLHGVEFIKTEFGLKVAIREMAKAYPDGFFLWYDDCFLIKPTSAAELRVTPVAGSFTKTGTRWNNMLNEIKDRLIKEGHTPVNYSTPHGPYWFDKSMVDEAFVDWPDMYGKFPWETWILSKRKWPGKKGHVAHYYKNNFKPPSNGVDVVNFNEIGFTIELQDWFLERFPEASVWEKSPATDTPKTKAISYSLYGKGCLYHRGILENIRLGEELYPDWEIVVHVSEDCPYKEEYRRRGARVIEHPPSSSSFGMTWRFCTVSDPKYTHILSRDADSFLTINERNAVNEWLQSGKSLHSILLKRNEHLHMFGGTFGMKYWPEMEQLVEAEKLAKSHAGHKYEEDEFFLRDVVLPFFTDDRLEHAYIDIEGTYKIEPSPTGKRVGRRELEALTMEFPDIDNLHIVRIDNTVKVENDAKLENALSHKLALTEVIKKNQYPALVLEKSVACYKAPESIDTLPKGLDWLWVGLSKYTLVNKQGKKIGQSFTVRDDGTVNMGDMCGAAGVVYFNRKGVDRMMEAVEKAIYQKRFASDLCIELCHEKGWERRALAVPWVYYNTTHRDRRDTYFDVSNESTLPIDNGVEVPEIEGLRILRSSEKDVPREIPYVTAPHLDPMLRATMSWQFICLKMLEEKNFPYLALEGDARLYGSVPDLSSLPTGLDWLWAGVSKCHYINGWMKQIHPLNVKVDEDGTFDAAHMLGFHGILFFNEIAVLRTLHACSRSLTKREYIDCSVVDLCHENNWERRALAVPWVYQHCPKTQGLTKFQVV
jgi:hypothetical protein